MHTHKSLVIANPCHANWNKMSATEKGRFCASCTKEVVDFRDKSKEDIIEYLENYKGEGQTCGQFSATQIDKVGKNYINSTLFKRIGISLMAFMGLFSFKEAKGQKPKMGKVAIKGDVSYNEYNQQNTVTEVTLFGTVRTLAGEKLAGAEIKINSDGKLLGTTKTIANGSFAVNLKVDKSMKSITLYTKVDGYETKITFIPEPQKEKIKVEIVMEQEIMVLGEIAIEIDTLKQVEEPEKTEKDTITKCSIIEQDTTVTENTIEVTNDNIPKDSSQTIHKIELISDKKWLKVFPNPSNDNATIEWPEDNESSVEVFDMNQKLIWSATIKGNKTVFNTTNLANGNYLVKITDKLTGKSETAILSIAH